MAWAGTPTYCADRAISTWETRALTHSRIRFYYLVQSPAKRNLTLPCNSNGPLIGVIAPTTPRPIRAQENIKRQSQKKKKWFPFPNLSFLFFLRSSSLECKWTYPIYGHQLSKPGVAPLHGILRPPVNLKCGPTTLGCIDHRSPDFFFAQNSIVRRRLCMKHLQSVFWRKRN